MHNFWSRDGWVYNVGFQSEHYQQFTGLPDRQGKEIYEGDIVEVKEHGNQKKGKRTVIVFDDVEVDGIYVLGWNCGFRPQEEVIGNIYENPELLK